MRNTEKIQFIAATITAISLCAAVFAQSPKVRLKTPEVNEKAFHAALLKSAAEYKTSYKQVTEKPSWAPTLCAMASVASAVPLQKLSSSDDESTHVGAKYERLFGLKTEVPSFAAP